MVWWPALTHLHPLPSGHKAYQAVGGVVFMLSGCNMDAGDPWEQMAHFHTSPDWPRGLSLAPHATFDRVIQQEVPSSTARLFLAGAWCIF